MSSYIYDRVPDRFGGRQEDYLKQSQIIVSQALTLIQESVRDQRELTQVFFETLDLFAARRMKIAQELGHEDASLFGRSRLAVWQGPMGITLLTHPYDAYNTKLLPYLQKTLQKMEHTQREFKQKYLKVPETTCFARRSEAEFQIISDKNTSEWFQIANFDTVRHVCTLCEIPPPPTKDQTSEFLSACITNKEAMQKLKVKDPDLYKRIKWTLALEQLRKCDPEKRKSDYAHVTVRLEIDGKMVALSHYFTWMYRDFMKDPVERMSYHSKIAILHQDPFLIDLVLKDISRLFKEVIEAKKSDIKTVKEKVAFIEWEFAHAMPYSRGSAAIAEWLERALYSYHGYEVTYNQEKMVNLEALTSPLAEFAANYDSMIQLTLTPSHSSAPSAPPPAAAAEPSSPPPPDAP